MRAIRAVLPLLILAWPGAAATISGRDVNVEIRDDGYCIREELTIRIEDPGDLESWSEYVISMNPFTELRQCSAEILDGQGRVVHRVRPRDRRTLESPGDSMYSTSRMEIVPFPPLEVGQRVHIETTTCSRPPYPAAVVPIERDTAQEDLVITVRRDPRLRWKVTGDSGFVTTAEDGGTVVFRGTGIPPWDPPRFAPPSNLSRSVLCLAWDGGAGWKHIGAWFSGLVESLPPPGPGIAAKAKDVCRGAGSPREQLAAIASFVKHEIRYVAVEIGHGAWRPSPPDEVLERGWGDCKDKAYLLKVMLEAVGLKADPVLIRAGRGGRFDEAFPSPFWFNHTITAVDAAAADARIDDPVVDGLLLVDPTVVHGGIGWLPPSLQDRPALVAAGGESRLIEVPADPSNERRAITVEGTVDDSGRLTGSVRLEIHGSEAVSWLMAMDSSRPTLVENRLGRELRSELRGCTVRRIALREVPGDVPAIEVLAWIERPDFARRRGDSHVMALSHPDPFPNARELRGRRVPVVLGCGVTTHRWILRLPGDWCPPSARSDGVENGVGVVRSVIEQREDGALVVVRTVGLDRAWIAAEAVPDLLDLVRTASRFFGRRLRARCPAPETARGPAAGQLLPDPS